MAVKIYTKTGDRGTTSLIGGTKVPKNHIRIEAYGTIDELNSFIGLLNDQVGSDFDAPRPHRNDPAGPSAGDHADLNTGTPGGGDLNEAAANKANHADPNTNAPAGGDRPVNALREVQDRLFTIGSQLATDPDKQVKMALPDLTEADIDFLEQEIDKIDRRVRPLKAFLLPGGDIAISTAHIARCVCRRAERHCVEMAEKGLVIDALIIQYLNRLSDYLFMVARYIAELRGIQEIEWRPRIDNRPR